MNDISFELKAVRQAAEETKDKYEENDGGKEGAANIKFCALLIIVPMGHMW